jgi:hypothetical protein
MLNDKKVTFRCPGNPKAALFTPVYLHDVESMRRHPEWEEVTVADDGAVAKVEQPEEGLHRPRLFVEPAPEQKEPKPKRKGK